MTRTTLMRLPLAVLAILLATITASGLKKEAARQKARYYYMEALTEQMAENADRAYELYKKSWEADPGYAEAASAVGTHRLMLDADTFRSHGGMMQSLKLMQSFVDEYPADFHESQYYAYVASRLDTLGEALRVFERLDTMFPKRTSTLLHLAETYMAAGQADNALAALDRYERAEGKSAQISLQKISYRLSMADTIGALGEAERLMSNNPRQPAFVILRGNVYDVIGQPDSALFYYELAEKVAPDNGNAKMALATYYKEHGDTTLYDTKIYEALLTEDFDLAQKTTLLADYLQRLLNDKQDTHRGDELFKVLKSQYPHEPQVLDLSARYNAAKNNLAEACEQISYAIDLEPEEASYWKQLMSYQIADGQNSGAMKTYDRAKTYLEPDQDFTLLYASAASADSCYDEAVEAYSGLLGGIDKSFCADDSLSDRSMLYRLSYDDLMRGSTIYTMLGDTYFQAGSANKAFTAYANAIFLDSDNAMALNNYAYFLTEEGGDLSKASEMSRRAVELSPDNPTFLDTRAWVLHKLGKTEEALEIQLKAVEQSADDPSSELYDHLGDMLDALGRRQEARDYWRKALELSPADSSIKTKLHD